MAVGEAYLLFMQDLSELTSIMGTTSLASAVLSIGGGSSVRIMSTVS